MHEGLISALLRPAALARVAAATTHAAALPEGFQRGVYLDVLTREVLDYVRNGHIESVAAMLLKSALEPGAFVSVEQAVYFSGLKAAWDLAHEGVPARARFKATLATNKDWKVEGTFSPVHLYSSSALIELKGFSRVFLLGKVESTRDRRVVLRPVLIGERVFMGDLRNPLAQYPGQYVHPELIDEFVSLRRKRSAKWDPSLMRDVPESLVKRALAGIIGESTFEGDWGGERSDLWTPTVHVQGVPMRAAFLLKGPARFRPMTIADLGKRGDQIDRLFSEPADLLVVQHCHYVTKQVHSMMQSYAFDLRQPRLFSVLDGQDTWRLLESAGKLPAAASASPQAAD